MNFDDMHLGDYTLAMLRHKRLIHVLEKINAKIECIDSDSGITHEQKLLLKYILLCETYKSISVDEIPDIVL